MTPTTAQTQGEVKVSLRPIDIRTVMVEIVGTSPLVTNKWSEKAKDMLASGGKDENGIKKKREPRNPEQSYRDSLYTMPGGKYGFPAIGFKAAMVRAGTYVDEKMTYLRGAFHIDCELIEIIGEPKMREDIVRLQMNKTDIRYRGEFTTWSAVLPITYNAGAISVAQITNLVMVAGFSVGVGEHRPEKDGQWGRFKLKEQ
jgi:hypothetical protein